MRTFVLILLPAAALVVWAIVEERKLRAMDSGAGKTMQQVGVRLAACLDAVAALLDLTWDYTARQAPQAETVQSGQGVIVSASQAADVTAQEALALDALRCGDGGGAISGAEKRRGVYPRHGRHRLWPSDAAKQPPTV